MLQKMYELGYLDFRRLILDHYMEFGISSLDAVILIKLLELYLEKRNIKTNDLVSQTGLNSSVVQESLNNLMNASFYEIYIEYKNGIGDEVYSFAPFFEKIRSFYSQEDKRDVSTNEMSEIIMLIEQELKRPLTPLELNIVSEWLNKDVYDYMDIKTALVECVKINRVTFKNIDKHLISARQNRSENYSQGKTAIDENQAKAITDIFSKIGKKQ